MATHRFLALPLSIALVLTTIVAGCIPAAAQDSRVEALRVRVDPYLKKVISEPDYLSSRLQMYWSTNASDVYIMGETFDHAGGERAQYPTVKFNGTRSVATAYDKPSKVEDFVPYDDDPDGCVTMVSRATGKMEKVHPSKTGCNIEAMNRMVLGIARDAARLYDVTSDTRYADMAEGVLDTYLKGIAGRSVPVDLNRGHQQTLSGLTTFEVIHEESISHVTEIYSLLKDHIDPSMYDLYDAALKKWAEVEIANGVPHNNWNLFQASFIAKIALVLRSDSAYSDGKGREYYLDCILNKDSVRQWSLRRMAEFGFDEDTGIWYESPGYSTTVLGDFASFADYLDEKAGVDVFAELPVIIKGVKASVQYLFPNRMIAGFGDTHPDYLQTKGIKSVLKYATRHGNTALAGEMSSLLEAVSKDASASSVEKWVSPYFYAPNVSWIMSRSGMDPSHDLAYSLNGSLGNHQHANGISLELYGKGYVLAPDGGIGKNLYSGLDYAEYYSQFPAHNTVCVDGISSYPAMMSNHPFNVVSTGCESVPSGEFPSWTYSTVSFHEPESGAQQMRSVSLLKVGEDGGYYIDVFRSSKKDGTDKTHDYFYHNLGQEMTLMDLSGRPLDLHQTNELAFAGGHLYAYSYIYDKWCTESDGSPLRAVFTTNLSDGRKIEMNMWMKGEKERKIIRALSPANLEYERMKDQPYDIGSQPVLTFIARQRGEAWMRPFVCVYEPTCTGEPSKILSVEFFSAEDPSDVGVRVRLENGNVDTVICKDDGAVKIERK